MIVNLVAGFMLVISIFGLTFFSIATHETYDEKNRSLLNCGLSLSIIGILVAIIMYTKF